MTLALTIMRVLRALPRTGKLDSHLDRCAAIGVLYPAFYEDVPRLRAAHVLRIVPLPDFFPSGFDMVGERVERQQTDGVSAGSKAPAIFNSAHIQCTPQTVH